MSTLPNSNQPLTFAEAYERAKRLVDGYVSLKVEATRFASGREQVDFRLGWFPGGGNSCDSMVGKSLESVLGQFEAKLLAAPTVDDAIASVGESVHTEPTDATAPDAFEEGRDPSRDTRIVAVG